MDTRLQFMNRMKTLLGSLFYIGVMYLFGFTLVTAITRGYPNEALMTVAAKALYLMHEFTEAYILSVVGYIILCGFYRIGNYLSLNDSKEAEGQ